MKSSDYVIEIPQFGSKHSINVSVSVGIVVWDLFSKLKDSELIEDRICLDNDSDIDIKNLMPRHDSRSTLFRRRNQKAASAVKFSKARRSPPNARFLAAAAPLPHLWVLVWSPVKVPVRPITSTAGTANPVVTSSRTSASGSSSCQTTPFFSTTAVAVLPARN